MESELLHFADEKDQEIQDALWKVPDSIHWNPEFLKISSKDLPFEFQETIDKHFWDLA